jgi:hypothetical protein
MEWYDNKIACSVSCLELAMYEIDLMGGSAAELACHLQGSTPYGIRFSHKPYRPSPTKGCHLERSSPYKGTAYRAVYFIS